MLERRAFLKSSALGLACMPFAACAADPFEGVDMSQDEPALFRISLAEWSLHRMLRAGDLDNLDFPKFAKDTFNIDAVEYVNQFFEDKASDHAYLDELKKRVSDCGSRSLLIMIDGEGALGDVDDAKRTEAIENHKPWVDAAKRLGCHSIRVNAQSSGSWDEQAKYAADGLRRLCECGDSHEINVIVENHGGLSSSGAWLAMVIKNVDHPRCGTLPDFGNFRIKDDEWYDRYVGVKELMPYAKAVSAKSHEFDSNGSETRTDYEKMMRIVLDAGYRGHVGIEYEGDGLSEVEGIRATKTLLERVRAKVAGDYS